MLEVLKSWQAYSVTSGSITLRFIERQIFVCCLDGGCLFVRVRCPYDCLPTHAGSREGERMDFFDKGRGGGGYIATTIYSLYLGSFCNEMACVMEALSKQWGYSAQRAVSVRTGLNTIPLIQGCSHSFLSILVFYPLLTVEITSSHLSLCLPPEKKVC